MILIRDFLDVLLVRCLFVEGEGEGRTMELCLFLWKGEGQGEKEGRINGRRGLIWLEEKREGSGWWRVLL